MLAMLVVVCTSGQLTRLAPVVAPAPCPMLAGEHTALGSPRSRGGDVGQQRR